MAIWAQEDAVREDSVETPVSDSRLMIGFQNFDPSAYQVQKRYRPTENDTAFQKTWWRRFVVGASAGYDVLSNLHAMNAQVPINAFLGYRITPVHQLRLQVGFEQMKIEGSEMTVKSLSGELQWLANLSSFSAGYNSSRPLEVSTLIGVGAKRYQGGMLPFTLSPYARMGLDLGVRIGPNINFFAQPYVGLTRNHTTLFQTEDPALYNLMYGVNAGVAARFDDSRKHYEKMAPSLQSFFFEATTGWGFNMKAFNLAQGGTNDALSIGRWFDPNFGLRLGIMGQENYWNKIQDPEHPSYSQREHHVSLGGRLEVLLNLNNLSKKNREKNEDAKWEVDLTGGVLYGYNAKNRMADTQGLWRCYYHGFTASLSALYRVSQGSYIFIEPRFFNNIYNIPYVNRPDKHETEIDRFMTFNFGARVYAASRKVRQAYRERDSLDGIGFEPHFWVGAGFGGWKNFESTRYKQEGFGSFQPSLNFSLGYDFNPYASVRLQADWQRLSRFNANTNTQYQLLDLRAMYVLPFTNLVRGCHRDNRFHTYLQLGGALSTFVGQSSSEGPGEYDYSPTPEYRTGNRTFGLVGGVLMAYDVSKRWDVYIESLGQYNFKQGFTPNLTNKPANCKWGLYGGVRYHFRPYNEEERAQWATDLPEWQKGWFVEASTGWLFPLQGSQHLGFGGSEALSRSGALFNLNFGHWLTPWLGGRIGLRAQQHSSQTSPTRSQDDKEYSFYHFSAGGALTLEALTNPINWTRSGRERKDPWFDLNLSAGFQIGFQGIGDNNVRHGEDVTGLFKRTIGFVTTAQALFRVTPGTWLYLEPRYSSLHFGTAGILDRASKRDALHSMAFSGGVRIMRPYRPQRNWTDGEPLGTTAEGDAFTTYGPFKPHWWVGLQAGGGRDLTTLKLIGDGTKVGIQPSGSFNIGYDLSPLLTLRSQVEYTRLGNVNFETRKVEHNNLYNLRLIGMLNMTNLWQNTRRWPRLSAYPELGISWAHHNAADIEEKKEGAHSNNAFGLMVGAMVAYRVTPQVDAVVETQEQYHCPAGFMPAQYDHTHIGNLYWNLTAGVRYHFRPGTLRSLNWKPYKPEWMKGWFGELAYGLSTPIGKGGSHLWGSSYTANLGHWFSSTLGVRAGLTGNFGRWGVDLTPAEHESLTGEQIHAEVSTSYAHWQVSGKLELMLNPLNFSSERRHRESEPFFDLNLAAGIEAGAFTDAHRQLNKHFSAKKYIGLTASAQALFRVAPQVQLFVEPRFHTTRTNLYNPRLRYTEKVNSPYLDISIGTRINRPTDKSKVREEVSTQLDNHTPGQLDNRFRPHFWVGMDLGGVKPMHCRHNYQNGIGLNPSIAIDGGYDLHPLVSFRLQAQYNWMSTLQTDVNYKVTTAAGTQQRFMGNFRQQTGLLNLRLMYMLNMTNLWQSTRHWPRLSAYWEFGPTVATILSDNYNLLDGEMAGGNNPTPLIQNAKGRTSLGLMTGINMAYRIKPQWDLTIECTGQYNFRLPFLPVVDKVRMSNVLMHVGLGTRFHF